MAPLRYEFSRPDDLEAALAAAPVAYVPLGTYEHHGWLLPVGFDGIAHPHTPQGSGAIRNGAHRCIPTPDP